jgi:hypothetical protein
VAKAAASGCICERQQAGNGHVEGLRWVAGDGYRWWIQQAQLRSSLAKQPADTACAAEAKSRCEGWRLQLVLRFLMTAMMAARTAPHVCMYVGEHTVQLVVDMVETLVCWCACQFEY